MEKVYWIFDIGKLNFRLAYNGYFTLYKKPNWVKIISFKIWKSKY